MNIFDVADVLKQIEATGSRKGKTLIIQINSKDGLFKDVLNFIYNPYIKTNIAKKKLSKAVKSLPEKIIGSIDEYMEYLSQSSGKDTEIATVQEYINGQPEEIKWLLEAMAIKTLKIGITGKTINDAMGYQLIPQFNVMLAEQYIKTTPVFGKVINNYEHFYGKKVIVTKKIDGVRTVVFVRANGDVQMYSREGHLLEGFTELQEAFKELPAGQVYEGEMVAINYNNLNALDLFQLTSRLTKIKGEKTGLEFQMFDALPIADFESGQCDIPTITRKEMCELIVQTFAPLTGHLIKYVYPRYVGEFDKDLIDTFAKEAFSREEEGIMIQVADAPYLCKRTKNIQKVKSIKSCDILCLGVYEGKTGENIGRLGGVIADFKGNAINVGSGFKSDERDKYWKDNSLIVGKIIEVQYTDEFLNDDGKLDLRFARFKTIRDDKTEPSYN